MRICVEGLDCSGKTTVARYLSEQLQVPYLKIRKGVTPEGSQEEITQRIVDEISEKLGTWDGVLDRGYLSAVATGRMYEGQMDWTKIVCPPNLVPDLTILMISSQKIALDRKKAFTPQDRIVLYSPQYESVKDWLMSNVKHPRVVVHNLSDSLGVLTCDVEHLVMPMLPLRSVCPSRLSENH